MKEPTYEQWQNKNIVKLWEAWLNYRRTSQKRDMTFEHFCQLQFAKERKKEIE